MAGIDEFMDRMYWQERVSSALDDFAWDERRRAAAENLSYRSRHKSPAEVLIERAEIDRLIANMKLQEMVSRMDKGSKSVFDFSKIKLSDLPGVYPFSTSSETESSD